MKILGHRGAKGEQPENTILGIHHALDCGVHGIEVDLHLTRDGEIVVIHDDSVDRTTNGRGQVRELTLTEIKELDAGLGQEVPTLEELLQLFSTQSGVTLFLELKAPGFEKQLIERLKSFPYRHQLVLKSFNHKILKKINELDPELTLAPLIYGLPLDPAGIIKSVGGKILSLSIQTYDAELVDQVHREGFKVCVWNCNDPAELVKIKSSGVDWVGTDYPSMIITKE